MGKRLYKMRYLFGVIVIILGVMLNINGSSQAIWNQVGVSERVDGSVQHKQYRTQEGAGDLFDYSFNPSAPEGLLFGMPRAIRSDEWLVQLPFYLAQSKAQEPLINDEYGQSGQNMVVAYNAPVKHLSLLGKPFNWGFLFLDASHALSWYWVVKMVAFLLLSNEVFLILTKGKKALSAIGAIWLTFTPTIQWWFMQHLGDVVIDSLLAIVAIHYFFYVKRILAKIGLAILLAISLIGFVFVIYPAFQVPFGYVLLLVFLVELIYALRSKLLKWWDYLIMAMTLAATGGVIVLTLKDSYAALEATLNTVYPGHRVSRGGGGKVHNLITALKQPILTQSSLVPEAFADNSNAVELSNGLSYIFLAPLAFLNKRFRLTKENLIGLGLLVISLLLTLYQFVELPEFLAKLTGLSYVPSNRAFQASSVIGVMASIWLINYLWDSKKPVSIPAFALLSLFEVAFVGLFIKIGGYTADQQQTLGLIFMLIFLIQLGICFPKKLRVLFYIGIMVYSFFSGMIVNPLNQGLPEIYDKQLAKALTKIEDDTPQAKWLTIGDNFLYQYVEIFGADTVNSTRFYPDKKLWHLLDPKNREEALWNRYAHMRVFLQNDQKSYVKVTAADQIQIYLNSQDLKRLNIDYLASTDNRTETILQTAGIDYQIVYPKDKDGNTIYALKR